MRLQAKQKNEGSIQGNLAEENAQLSAALEEERSRRQHAEVCLFPFFFSCNFFLRFETDTHILSHSCSRTKI